MRPSDFGLSSLQKLFKLPFAVNRFTFNHIIPHFNDNVRVFKHCGKRKKCWYPAIPHFTTMLSTMSKNLDSFLPLSTVGL